jgi:hypothetical protein
VTPRGSTLLAPRVSRDTCLKWIIHALLVLSLLAHVKDRTARLKSIIRTPRFLRSHRLSGVLRHLSGTLLGTMIWLSGALSGCQHPPPMLTLRSGYRLPSVELLDRHQHTCEMPLREVCCPGRHGAILKHRGIGLFCDCQRPRENWGRTNASI